MAPSPREFETYAMYLKEYLGIVNPSTKEAIHRKKILKEWLDNELKKWENTQN